MSRQLPFTRVTSYGIGDVRTKSDTIHRGFDKEDKFSPLYPSSLECSFMQGAAAVSAYVTHGVFPNESHKRFSSLSGTKDGFENFWITDSCPQTVCAVKGVAPFQIISLAGTIAAALHI